MIQRPKRAAAVMYLGTGGPPSSPPTALFLRNSRIMIAMRAPEQKIVTEKAKLEKKNKIGQQIARRTFNPFNSLSRWHFEVASMWSVINCCHGPCQSDTQENVDRITARHVANTGISVLVLNGCHFTCERIWKKRFEWHSVTFDDPKPSIRLPGILVPRATNTMAVTESLIPNVQPKCDATSPIIAVTTPIERIEITKHKYPPAMSAKKGKKRSV